MKPIGKCLIGFSTKFDSYFLRIFVFSAYRPIYEECYSR
ncbi:hypothetical protein EVA_15301 [gut metagenome]|uniref:Uncharacterized protein n=1 Tax=gut metagenome TaxID=749906 RepID=J9FNU2_9ZZZZ